MVTPTKSAASNYHYCHMGIACARLTRGACSTAERLQVVANNLVDYLAAGDPLERFLDHFPSVTREQAVAALEIAGDLLASRAHPAR